MVDIWAPWCGPCKLIGPIVDELADEYKGRIIIGKLNADYNSKQSEFKVSGIPTILFFKNGKVVDRIVGAKPKDQLISVIEKYASPVVPA